MSHNAPDTITAPWDDETVDALNATQTAGKLHPFTCRVSSGHGGGYLWATSDGWVCREPGCDYKQDWALAYMATKDAARPWWQSVQDEINRALEGQ